MLSFRPTDEKAGSATYEALVDGNTAGKCSFTFSGYEMKITAVCCDDDIIAEGLLRSSMNYCANRGAYAAFIGKEMLTPAAQRLGFSEDNLSVEIPDALASSCCSCSK